MVEVKAYPHQAGSLEFEELVSKTVGLLLRTMKKYFTTGRYVIIDSDFCFLKGFIQLRTEVIFACAVINKRKYWPSMVLGKNMEDHFGEVEVGDTDSTQGTVDDVI